MTFFDWLAVTVGILGFAFGLNCYWHLRRWARIIQGARLVVAYKKRVQLQATLEDVALWVRALDKNERGRTFYRQRETTIAITRALVPASRWSRKRNEPTPQAQAQEGTWSAKADKAATNG